MNVEALEGVTFREATPDDAVFLLDMLVAAINWDAGREPMTHAEVMQDPGTHHYVASWARPEDAGVLAVHGGNRPIGAAWLRLFQASDPGYGFVSPEVPELSLAVTSEWRGKGVGSALLAQITHLAKQVGFNRISLSVERANFAHRFYVREGFTVVESGRDSDTMVKILNTS